jgi:RhtB (resistance to homoserine/threonine) family protein
VELLPFIGVAAVLVVTPGADMALVARNALVHGRRAGLATAFGVNLGIAAWSLAAAVGVAAVVQASAPLFTALKLLGAVYLVYLGIQAWRHGRSAQAKETRPRPIDEAAAFRQGVVSNLLNPKIGLFFTAILPQFAPHDPPLFDLLALGAVFNAMGVVWLTTYAILVAHGRTLLERPRVKAAMDRVTGGLLIGLGIRLALERRPMV